MLDSRIPLSFQPPQIESPLAQYGQMVQLYAMMQKQQQQQQALMRQKQFEAELGAAGDDPEKQIAVARKYGDPKDIMHFAAQSADRKAKAEADRIALTERMEQQRVLQRERLEQQAELARQRSEDQRLSQAERNQARMDMIRLAASLRPPHQGPEPIKVQDEQGNVKLFDRGGNLIRDLGKVAAPSVAAQKAESERVKQVRNINEAITELGRAVKDGGLIDQSTGSGAGAMIDKAAGFVGYATPGAIAVGQLQPIYDIVLKMVPRFEGPQSDKDTQSYKEASGQLANPNIPNSQKKAAAKTILQLMTKRRDQFASKDSDIPPASSGGSGVKFLGFEK